MDSTRTETFDAKIERWIGGAIAMLFAFAALFGLIWGIGQLAHAVLPADDSPLAGDVRPATAEEFADVNGAIKQSGGIGAAWIYHLAGSARGYRHAWYACFAGCQILVTLTKPFGKGEIEFQHVTRESYLGLYLASLVEYYRLDSPDLRRGIAPSFAN